MHHCRWFVTLNAETWGGEESPKGLATQGYSYDSSNASSVDLRMKPPLQYTSPELVLDARQQQQRPLSLASDVFSLGAVVYEVMCRQQMMTALNAGEYRAFVTSTHLLPMSKVPIGLQARCFSLPLGHRSFFLFPKWNNVFFGHFYPIYTLFR